MKAIPKEVYGHIENAKQYRDVALSQLSRTDFAIPILLLILSWENITIADQKLHAWSQEVSIDPKLLKDHEEKLKEAPKLSRTIIGLTGTPAETESFSTPKELKKLRELCQWEASSSRFFRYWNTDEFRNKLIDKIKWVELMVKIHKEYLVAAT